MNILHSFLYALSSASKSLQAYLEKKIGKDNERQIATHERKLK